MSFYEKDFDPIDFSFMTDGSDPILEIMLILTEKWGLTGDLNSGSISFTTRFYDEGVIFPQVVISALGGDESPPIDLGSSGATYADRELIGFDIWVRPQSDSGKSLGWAKNAMYVMRKELDRIFQSGSNLNNDSEQRFLYLVGWNRKDDLTARPPIFHLAGTAYLVKYVKGS